MTESTDPSGSEAPHDILAAEEFGIGTRDERYPADPRGIQEPHDVLAADEFPFPAPVEAAEKPSLGRRAAQPQAWLPALLLLVVGAAIFAASRRRG